MKIEFTASATPRPGDYLIRFFTRAGRDSLPVDATRAEFSGAPNSLLALHERRTLCVGLGDARKIAAGAIRSAAGAAVMELKKMGRLNALLDLCEYPDFAAAAAEGAVIAGYRFDQYTGTKNPRFGRLAIRLPEKSLARGKKSGAEAALIATAANDARELANQPPNLFYPESLAREAARIAKEKGLSIRVFDVKKLKAAGFGGILAVGSGSSREPRLILLEHRGAPHSKETIALIGKAITFDTGGISIKPAAGMESMVFDKCGGIAVLGAMSAIAGLNLKRNVLGIIAAAENMPGPDAYRPGDIITMFGGKTVEVLSTDAEGRMVLADSIAYARLERKVSAIVDIATLTGAVGVALGKYAAGLWANDEALKEKLIAAAERTGERVWPMPLYQEYSDQIKSDVALIKNTGGRHGGACTAAAFLKTFAEETPWAHLDIASMASIEKDRPTMARGATGFGVRLLVDLVRNWREDSHG